MRLKMSTNNDTEKITPQEVCGDTAPPQEGAGARNEGCGGAGVPPQFEQLYREYSIAVETTTGCGSRGQHYIDNAWDKMVEFSKLHPEIDKKMLGCKHICTNDGTSGLASGVLAGMGSIFGAPSRGLIPAYRYPVAKYEWSVDDCRHCYHTTHQQPQGIVPCVMIDKWIPDDFVVQIFQNEPHFIRQYIKLTGIRFLFKDYANIVIKLPTPKLLGKICEFEASVKSFVQTHNKQELRFISSIDGVLNLMHLRTTNTTTFLEKDEYSGQYYPTSKLDKFSLCNVIIRPSRICVIRNIPSSTDTRYKVSWIVEQIGQNDRLSEKIMDESLP